jgi:hypothetical protein
MQGAYLALRDVDYSCSRRKPMASVLSLTHIFRMNTTLSNGRVSYATADLEIARAINELRGRIKLR